MTDQRSSQLYLKIDEIKVVFMGNLHVPRKVKILSTGIGI